MPARRKIHLQLTEQGDYDLGLVCEGDPIYCGDGSHDEDLVCGRCHRTLFLALSRSDVFAFIAKNFGSKPFRRPFPLVAECDCGATNRVWPVFTD